ncbi:hypothetical protein CAPTEDRAFT_103161, partial [Capitella teleta]
MPLCGRYGIVYRLTFDVTTLKRVNWEHSKRLITGCLLCLSADNFKTIVFAVVCERDANELSRGHILIELDDHMVEIDHTAEYEMVESTTYFEAYKHNLKRIQEIEELPFQEYLLNADVDDVRAPKYLREPDATLVLSRRRYPALKLSRWPEKEALELNESQFSAFQNALTKEFAIIQGPPGTGKTYLGLKVMETLLKNKTTWRKQGEGCILIVCYTNHALDQFLEGIISQSALEPGQLVRIGGKSKSEELQKFNIASQDVHDGFQQQVNKKRIRKIKSLLKALAKEHTSMDYEEANRVTDVWSLDQQGRFRLYRSWLDRLFSTVGMDLKHKCTKYNALADRIQEAYSIQDSDILEGALVVGLTTTGAAKHTAMMSQLKPTITIIEEAAEVLEAHISTLLSVHCEHLILIGDHQQLRPNPAVYTLAKNYNLDVSLFERMVKNGMCCSQLDMQHRMRPEIAQLITPHIYKQLYNHPSVFDRDNILGISGNVLFVDHQEMESTVEDTMSKSNEHEALFIIKLIRYLLHQGYEASQITVLTMYLGQMFLIKKKMADFAKDDMMRVTPVDNFQGEENEIILLSCVRSNADDKIGFLNVSNRVCVALSRARKGFYCIGNISLLRKKSPLWENICSELDKDENVVDGIPCVCQNHSDSKFVARFPADFDQAPLGGCHLPCSFRLQCGHTCEWLCHPFDKKHDEYKCKKPCTKSCLNGHLCTSLCYKDCPPCKKLMAKVIPECGHDQMVPCYLDPALYPCQDICDREKPCGHICKKRCGDPCLPCRQPVLKTLPSCGHEQKVQCSDEIKKCTQPCEHVLKCGHKCPGKCGDCKAVRHSACRKRCTQNLLCGHQCAGKCSQPCLPCTFKCQGGCSHSSCNESCGIPCFWCQKPCEWSCKHLRCGLLCWDPCQRLPCNYPCPKSLRCGHQCPGLCGEECPLVCKTCHLDLYKRITKGRQEMLIILNPCRHVFPVSQLDAHFEIKKLPGGHQQVQIPSCPACKRAVKVCNRYNTIIKQAALDLNRIK